MNRRAFIAGLGMSALPLLAWSQSNRPIIGFLSSRSPGESEGVVAAFRNGLADTGYVVGQNIAVEYRWAEGRYDRLPELAAELVNMRVAVMLSAGGPPAAIAAKKSTSTIPIVFSAADDPVGLGLVDSLSRPGGNVTGMSLFNADLSAKRISLMRELVPASRTIAYLTNPANPSTRIEVNSALEVARAIAISVKVFNASNENELQKAFSDIVAQHIDALIVAGEPFFDSRRALIVELAAKHALPASYGWRENVVLGGLMSYGTSIVEAYRGAGVYCGRILKGEQPGNLPVLQPAKFELVLNLKTAKALGLSVPPSLLTAADEIIE